MQSHPKSVPRTKLALFQNTPAALGSQSPMKIEIISNLWNEEHRSAKIDFLGPQLKRNKRNTCNWAKTRSSSRNTEICFFEFLLLRTSYKRNDKNVIKVECPVRHQFRFTSWALIRASFEVTDFNNYFQSHRRLQPDLIKRGTQISPISCADLSVSLKFMND